MRLQWPSVAPPWKCTCFLKFSSGLSRHSSRAIIKGSISDFCPIDSNEIKICLNCVCVWVCVNIQNIVLKETHTSSDFEYRWYWGSVCVSNLCMEVFLFSLVFGPIKDNLYLSTIINTYFNIQVHISLFFCGVKSQCVNMHNLLWKYVF